MIMFTFIFTANGIDSSLNDFCVIAQFVLPPKIFKNVGMSGMVLSSKNERKLNLMMNCNQ